MITINNKFINILPTLNKFNITLVACLNIFPDIDEVKKSTLELENRIRAFKSYLQTELARLKAAEMELNQNVSTRTY